MHASTLVIFLWCFMLLKILLVFLILTNEAICSTFPSSNTLEDDFFGEEEEEEIKGFASEASLAANPVPSPVSTALVPNSPVSHTPSIKMTLNLMNFADDLLFKIAEYVDFPHKSLGSLCRYSRQIFSKITPAQIISRQLEIPEFGALPTDPDLKYLVNFDSCFFENDKILVILTDLALLKVLPSLKPKILRILYTKAKSFIRREHLLSLVHPFQETHSTISALLHAFFSFDDYEMVFDIFDNFPETHPTGDFVFGEEFILAALKFDKTENLLKVYSRNTFAQNRFDLACNILSLSFDPKALELVMQSVFREHERWNPNYTETFLNAWIYALVYSDKPIKEEKYAVLEDLYEFVHRLTAQNTPLNFRKTVLLTLIAVRTRKAQEIVEGHLRDLLIVIGTLGVLRDNYQGFFEELLWSLVVEKRLDHFFYFLRHLQWDKSFQLSKLRVAIARIESEEFMNTFISDFDVRLLFDNDLNGDAFYNKRLFLYLNGKPDERSFLEICTFDKKLFDYLIEHFKTDCEKWQNFFAMHRSLSAATFSHFFLYLLQNLPDLGVFEMISDLLHREGSSLRIIPWGYQRISLNLKSADFLLRNESLHPLLKFLSRFIKFELEINVMVNLIVTDACRDPEILKLFDFSVKDLLIQLNHWSAHLKYMRLFDLSENAHFRQLQSAISTLKTRNIGSMNQEQLDASIMAIFDSILGYLKAERPLDYLQLLPYSILRRTILDDPYLMQRALSSGDLFKINRFFERIRGNTVKVKASFDVDSIKTAILMNRIDLRAIE